MPGPGPVLLMTRPRGQAEQFVADLRASGAEVEVVYAPLLDIALTGPLPAQDRWAGLIFTSVHGVRAWVALGGRTDIPAFAVGERTARAARDAGLRVTSADGNADTLISLLLDRNPRTPLLHVRGTHSRGDVARRLKQAGLPAQEAIVYDQREQDQPAKAISVLSGDRPVVAPLFSPRTAALFGKLPIKAPLLVAGMSEAVVNALGPVHIWKLEIASRPDSQAMQAAVRELLEAARESGED